MKRHWACVRCGSSTSPWYDGDPSIGIVCHCGRRMELRAGTVDEPQKDDAVTLPTRGELQRKLDSANAQLKHSHSEFCQQYNLRIEAQADLAAACGEADALYDENAGLRRVAAARRRQHEQSHKAFCRWYDRGYAAEAALETAEARLRCLAADNKRMREALKQIRVDALAASYVTYGDIVVSVNNKVLINKTADVMGAK